MNRIVTLADEIVQVLNDASFDSVVVAVREYRPVHTLKDLKDLKVSVVPRIAESNMVTRQMANHNIEVDIGIQKKVDGRILNAEIDPLMDLVQAIADLIRTTREFETAAWLNTANDPIFNPEHMTEQGVFTSVLTCTFKVIEV